MTTIAIIIMTICIVALLYGAWRNRRNPISMSNSSNGKTVGVINAIVVGIHDRREAILSDEVVLDLLKEYKSQIKFYDYYGNSIIIVEENPDTEALGPWKEQRHAISDDAPGCITPWALAEMAEWKLTPGKYFQTSSVGLQAFNRTMMVAIMFGVGLLAFLFYSSQTGA